MGYPISFEIFFAFGMSVIGSAVPGTSGTLNLAAAFFAESLLPIIRIASGGGPTNRRPAFITSDAKASIHAPQSQEVPA